MKNELRKLKTLILMQTKEKIDLSFLNNYKQFLFVAFKKIMLIGIFTGAIYLGLSYGQRFNLFNLVTNFTMIFFVSILVCVSIVSCTITLMKTFYFSEDNFMLFSLAVKPNTIFISKLGLAFIIELNRNFTYLMPFFLAYGLTRHYPLTYYFNFLWLFILLTLAIVVISANCSLPALIITKILKKIKYLHVFILIACSILFWLAIQKIITYIPEEFSLLGRWSYYSQQINAFLISFSHRAFPINHITQLIVGNNGYYGYKFVTKANLQVLGYFLLTIIIAVIFLYIVTRFVFFQMVTNSYARRKNKIYFKKKNRRSLILISEMKKEFLILFRTPALFFQNIIYLIILPIAIYLLNRIFFAINLRSDGYNMCLSFNMLMITLISLTSTSNLANSFGSEKTALFLLKTRPINLANFIISKVFMQMLLMIISVAIACYIVYLYQPTISLTNSFYFYFIIILLNFAYLFWIIQFDLANPFNNKMLFNKTEIKSYLLLFLLSFCSFLLSYFFLKENRHVVWVKLFYATAFLLLIRLYILRRYIKVYYNELGGSC